MKLPSLFSRGRSRKPVEELVLKNLTFVGEQDGDLERKLKAKLAELFADRKNMTKA
jgi:hypothetical protein